jgi:hypothetical protein
MFTYNNIYNLYIAFKLHVPIIHVSHVHTLHVLHVHTLHVLHVHT